MQNLRDYLTREGWKKEALKFWRRLMVEKVWR